MTPGCYTGALARGVRSSRAMRKIVLIADLVAIIGAGMWFGSYQWWMFYVFLACFIVIEISVKYLTEIYWTARDDP